jgi:hypothetical protein
MSAAARLFAETLRVRLQGVGSVALPRMVTVPAPVFVVEGGPIPAMQAAFETVPLGPPKKMALIVGLTERLAEHSAESVEGLVRVALAEQAGKSLDAVVFDANPASASRPAGLLTGVTALTATAGGGIEALVGDVKQLVAAITAAGGGNDIWIFASPPQAAAAALYAPDSTLPIVPTPALPSGQIIAVEVGAVASGFSGVPEFDISRMAPVHLETNPAAVGTPGSPNLVAAPLMSAWQQQLLFLRLILRCSWTVRAPGMVQVVNSATW